VSEQHQTRTWACPQCGLSITRDAVFCPNCGWTSLQPEKTPPPTRLAADRPEPVPIPPPEGALAGIRKVLSFVALIAGFIGLTVAGNLSRSYLRGSIHTLAHKPALMTVAACWVATVACFVACVFVHPAAMRFADRYAYWAERWSQRHGDRPTWHW